MGFADRLWASAAATEAAIFAHPFVLGLADGSLPMPRFVVYLRQDHVFLTAYARLLALAVAAAEAHGDMETLAELLRATLVIEASGHRDTCQALGIAPAQLEATVPATFTAGYAAHLLAVGRRGVLGEIAAALLPCQWGYARIGQRLATAGAPSVAPYAAWIAAYAAPEYQRTARWVWDLVDRCGAAMPQAARREAAQAFTESMRWESAFWDGCWAADGDA